MLKLRRRTVAAVVLVGTLAAIPLVLGKASMHDASPAAKADAARAAHAALLEREHEDGGADAEAYADRAYPDSEITLDEVQGAITADKKVKAKGPKFLAKKWDALGPDTLDVDRLGTQSFIKPTQWSGRVTALTIDPGCKPLPQPCSLYVGAAGGGVWKSKNALAPKPAWKQISDDIPTNAIGSIAVDPNDASGNTLYVGTGEGNSSGDSEAGLGLYKSTDGGAHWALVQGSLAITNLRSITWVAVQPGNPNHIVITTRSGQRGIGSNATNTGTVTAQSPPVGVYNSTDGGATWTLVQTNGTGANEVKFDPADPHTVYAALATVGLVRSQADGAAGTWSPIFALNRGRFSFAPVKLANGKTRVYLADASGGGGTAAEVFRVEDASQPAATLTASNNAAWTRISNPTAGTPGNAVHNYCNTPLVGSQCTYDMYVMSPAEKPDMVIVGGLMHYEELKPYVNQAATVVGQRSNGRAVLMSQDAGATWTDVTGDVGGESMHPDQHALAFVPGNPDQWFAGSDGGVIRSSGQWADASAQCDSRGLTEANLAECRKWLKQIPSVLTTVNAGLGTLQMTSISVSPYSPDDTAMTGTQDNGTLSFSGKSRWYLPLTGDGGDSGFDATDPHLRFHTYTGGQMDVNYNDVDPSSWLWIGDRFIVGFPESQRFYAPVIPDPMASKTIFVGAQSVWRTTTAGGDRAFLEQHCNTAVGEFPSDLLYTGPCGSPENWPKLGTSTLTNSSTSPPSPYGTTKGGNTLSALARARDAGTMWAGTGAGRVLVSRNVNAADPAAVTFTRIDDPVAQPARAVSSIHVDPANPNHAFVTFSGYEVNTPLALGHVFDVVFDPATGKATWTNISYDIGDQPVNDIVLDPESGMLFISTDFGVFLNEPGTQTWTPAAEGLPSVAVSGLTYAKAQHGPRRYIYAATHGRGAYRLQIH
jgi:hypothetical protein